jgi:antitoxin (DNA-binding transcriptional repressor) of toxin-antitoxin stability system
MVRVGRCYYDERHHAGECAELTHRGYAVVSLVPAVRKLDRGPILPVRVPTSNEPDASELVRVVRALG